MEFFRNIKKHGGLIKTIKNYNYRKSGRKKIEEEIETIFYILNHCTDIKDFPKPIGNLKKLHKCNLLLILLFDKIAKKEGWTYWLDCGTLLGSIRHKGFIPWDDDMDIGMPRKDYENMLATLPRYFKKMDLKMTFFINPDTNAVGIGIDHENTGIWCDIFYYDTCFCNNDDEIKNGELLKSIYKKHKSFMHSLNHGTYKKPLLITNSLACNAIYPSPEMKWTYFYTYSTDDVFPLKLGDFEGHKLPIPNNYKLFLTNYYGQKYMEYPRCGILHHGEESGRPPLADWAILNGVDMDRLSSEISDEIAKIDAD